MVLLLHSLRLWTHTLNLSPSVPFSAIESLWEAFNDVADGFGITLYEFQEISAELCTPLGVNRAKMDDKSQALFLLLDNDANGLIDAIEFLAATCVASGLANKDTLEFVFKCYDFDGSQELTIDEVTLAMKSTLTGLCKLSGNMPPREEDLEVQAMDAFLQSGKSESGKITLMDIIKYCTENPECRSWMEFYDDPPEMELNKQEILDAEIDYQHESGESPLCSLCACEVYRSPSHTHSLPAPPSHRHRLRQLRLVCVRQQRRHERSARLAVGEHHSGEYTHT